MKRYFKVMYVSTKMSLMREMEYRADFAMFFLQMLTFVFFNLLFYKAVLGSVGSIGGWTYPDMVILFGTYAVIDGIFMTFILTGVSRIESLVRSGELDAYLLKPIDSQFLVSIQRVNFPQFPSIFFGFFIVYYGFSLGHYVVPWTMIPLYLLFILISSVIFYSMALIISCIIFVIDKADDLKEIIFSVKQFAKFPDIYSGYVRYFMMLFVPIVFSSFVPAGILLGKISIAFLLYYLVIAVLSLVVSRIVWKKGLKKYKSAGG